MNYIQLEDKSLFKKQIAYVDTKNLIADKLFIENEIHVDFISDFVNPKLRDYPIVVISYKKKYHDLIINLMSELEKRAILTGFRDYPDISDKLIKLIEK